MIESVTSWAHSNKPVLNFKRYVARHIRHIPLPLTIKLRFYLQVAVELLADFPADGQSEPIIGFELFT